MIRKTLAVGIVFLFIVSIVTPAVISIDESEEDDDYLENLAFACYDEYDSNAKYEYYKERLLNDYSNDEVEIVEPVEAVVYEETYLPLDGPMDSAWPMKCHDTHHTSRSPYSTAHIDDLEKWRFRCGGVDGSPVIGDNGTIYFGDKDRDIYAIYPNGMLKWTYHTVDWITSAPALAEDGTLYVGSWGDYLYAFNSTTGAKKWSVSLGDTIGSSPAIGEDGTIYVGDTGGRLWAVNPNGTKKWNYPTGGGNISGDPAIGDDGTIYIGTWFEYFYAINPNGTLKWKFKTGDIIKAPPSIADDGTVYIGSFDDYLYALYPNNGTMKWKCNIWKGTDTNPSIASDGTIYVCSSSKLFAIYPNNGTKKWTYDFPSERHIGKSSPTISAEGTIYVGTNIGSGSVSGGDIFAINPDGTERWRKLIVDKGWVDSSPCIAEDGTVFIGSQSEGRGYIHAFGPVESNSPPNAPTISGETNGEAGDGYWYTFLAVDPDNNPVTFYIDWGDGSEGWKVEGASGGKYYYEHTWSEQGDYTIRAKAIDTLGEESDWGYLGVTMPMNQHSYSFPLLQRLLERFPNMFPILRNLFDLE
jgi:outer membrane protein assembly factor BamB